MRKSRICFVNYEYPAARNGLQRDNLNKHMSHGNGKTDISAESPRHGSPAWLPMVGRITGMVGGINGPLAGRARTSALTQSTRRATDTQQGSERTRIPQSEQCSHGAVAKEKKKKKGRKRKLTKAQTRQEVEGGWGMKRCIRQGQVPAVAWRYWE